jgi:hypothetical protein
MKSTSKLLCSNLFIRNPSTAYHSTQHCLQSTNIIKITMTCVTSPTQCRHLTDATPNAASVPLPTKKKPGKPPKTLESMTILNGTYAPPPPSKRKIHELSPAQKLQIISYILNTSFYDADFANGGPKRRCLEGLEYKGFYRPPTLDHLQAYFKVSKATLSGIWRNRERIVAARGKRRYRSAREEGEGKEMEKASPSAGEQVMPLG